MWRPSSREMSSLLKVSPGMSWRFLSQKIAQKEPLKWMPSTHANATRPLGEAAAAADPALRPFGLLGHTRHRVYRLRSQAIFL